MFLSFYRSHSAPAFPEFVGGGDCELCFAAFITPSYASELINTEVRCNITDVGVKRMHALISFYRTVS